MSEAGNKSFSVTAEALPEVQTSKSKVRKILMSSHNDKGLSQTSGGLPQPPGFGRPGGPLRPPLRAPRDASVPAKKRARPASRKSKLAISAEGKTRFAELDALIAAEGEAEVRDKAQRSTSSLKPKRKRRSPPLPGEYRGVVIRTAMEHRKQFRALFAADPTIRDRGARLYRSLLFPQRRGKKPTRRVVLAVAFLKKLGPKPRSSDWNRVDLKCLPGLDRLSDLERRDQRRRFHHAVRTYLRRHKIKLE